MKKTILLLLVIACTYVGIGKCMEKSDMIPSEAIRMRIIPNSNTEYDQSVKMKVKEEVEKTVFTTLKDTKGIESARAELHQNLPQIDRSVQKVLEREKYTLPYSIHYGMNYFPEKEYKGMTYKAGEYESLVVTLGEGKGDNWWCVLFPPLCMVEAEESDEVEYKLFVEELIDKYL